ncbi:hypothetical protein AB0M46_04730 [Dactylosporangium sp. NPDC051485]
MRAAATVPASQIRTGRRGPAAQALAVSPDTSMIAAAFGYKVMIWHRHW